MNEVGTDHPGTARLLSAIAEDVVDPRSDAGVTPDPFDGGCAADCQPITKRPVAPVGDADPLADVTERMIGRAIMLGMAMAADVLIRNGFVGGCEAVRNEAKAEAARRGLES
jgi:hypothetical protein